MKINLLKIFVGNILMCFICLPVYPQLGSVAKTLGKSVVKKSVKQSVKAETKVVGHHAVADAVAKQMVKRGLREQLTQRLGKEGFKSFFEYGNKRLVSKAAKTRSSVVTQKMSHSNYKSLLKGGGKVVSKGLKYSPRLERAISVLPESSRKVLLEICEANPKMLSFFNAHPEFVANWDYLSKMLPTQRSNPDFLSMFVHADDYAKYGGNKLKNFVYKEVGDVVEVYDATGKRMHARIAPGRMIEITDDNPNNWFVQLKPLAKAKYKIRGAEYSIDEAGRVTKAEFHVNESAFRQTKVRDGNVQSSMHKVKNSLENDHAGHLQGERFGGSSNMINLVPMSKDVNLSHFKSLENTWNKLAKEGKDVKVNIDIRYAGQSDRPESFIVQYEVDGKIFKEIIPNL